MYKGSKQDVKVNHTIQGGIIEETNGDLGGSRHELCISYGQKITNILLDAGDAPVNNQVAGKKEHLSGSDIKDNDAVIISHIHRDHGGEIVFIPKQGYNKPIHMHSTAKKLADILLYDALKKQDETIKNTNEQLKRARELLRKANQSLSILLGVNSTRNIKPLAQDMLNLEEIERIFKKNKIERINPLSQAELDTHKPSYLKREFSEEDVIAAIKNIAPIQYGEEISLIKNFVKAKFYNAGHIQGSVLTLLKIIGDHTKPHSTFNVLYTGDIGRFKDPGKVGVPQIPKEKLDYMIIEGTYGNALHVDRTYEKRRFIDELNNAEGLVLIPCFVIERMQEVREMLGAAIDNNQLVLEKGEKIYFDSKLGYNISKEYLMADSKNAYPHLKDHPQMERISDKESIEGVKASKKIMGHKGRTIVVCSGGMAENGSVMEYLTHAMGSRDAKILTTGFQAPGTIGHKLLHNDFSEPLIINGKPITENNAYVNSFSFSSHGDQDDLMHFIKNCKLSDDVKITIVHGGIQREGLEEKIREYLTAQDLKKKKENRGKREVFVPEKNGDSVSI
ncbi:MAG: MBL fold metallo-hydrolase [Candidatus Absconditabacteria bacterium]